jgi:hypothetical protein
LALIAQPAFGAFAPAIIGHPPFGAATAAVTVEAGWYKDPSTRYEQRYWDGQKWTEHVHTGGVQSTDPPVA